MYISHDVVSMKITLMSYTTTINNNKYDDGTIYTNIHLKSRHLKSIYFSGGDIITNIQLLPLLCDAAT